jgi:hypothetical protein
MHCRTTESRPPQSEAFNQLLEGSRQVPMATIRIGLPRQACQTLSPICAQLALKPAQLQTVLTRYLRQRHAIFQARTQQAEPIQGKLPSRLWQGREPWVFSRPR